ncbi:DUF447 family protein [Paraburkholderia sp. Ac-20342]|uniref:DUF447 domain-containing protein n=1 Tax=Paraburkholderia sp. Ac-20342 TaxID=2703889 RepID=UPI0019814041|nr:DUF447 domain-containing protein [Paraburkholderia sp. Ac-20342]MBN3851018.1 DUF447 family protein [Paraburkholderia sp. Ac-20342]
MIHETIVTTAACDGRPHIAPMGARYEGERIVLAPFRPSTTLDNIVASRAAVLNFTTDVRIFAGCVTHSATDWPTVRASRVASVRLAESLAHAELELDELREDAERPVLLMKCVHRENHAPFAGFNRAQSAVVEGAILVSRLFMLPAAKIDSEMAYLQIAIDKTAGDNERTAWGWLVDAVARHRAGLEAAGGQQPAAAVHH